MNLTATHVNYFFTCKRKLWLFSRNIKCEQESYFVKIGKIYHEDFEKESIEIGRSKGSDYYENIYKEGLRLI